MAILDAATFEAVAHTGLDSDVIDAAIAREEGDLARLIGPLEDEQTATLHPAPRSGGPLCLPRFVDELGTVSIDGVELAEGDVALISDGAGRRGGCIERTRSTVWGGVVAVTFTPDDAPQLEAYLIEAVRLALVPDHERVVAEDRNTATLHRDNVAWMLDRLMRRIRPVPRTLTVPVGPYGAERVTRVVLT